MRPPVRASFPRIQYFLTSILLTLLIVPTVLAQGQLTGQIEGTVRDVNGAVIQGASVEAKNLGTGASKTATTKDDGRYTILSLQPGNYSITATKQGFKPGVVENTALTVGQILTANFDL